MGADIGPIAFVTHGGVTTKVPDFRVRDPTDDEDHDGWSVILIARQVICRRRYSGEQKRRRSR